MYDYGDIKKIGIRTTIISFDPFLHRPDVSQLTDAQVGRKYGLSTATVKAMRRHQDVPCHELQCQPGDILDATTAYCIPAKDKAPDA